MAKILDILLGRDQSSAQQAKERVKLVLIHDRTDVTPAELDDLKDELIDVISRYVAIDPKGVHIEMASEGRQQRLIADIPLQPTRRRRKR